MCLSPYEKCFKVHYELNEKGLMITHIDIQRPYAGISIVKTILHLDENMIWLSEIRWALHDPASFFIVIRKSYKLPMTLGSNC
jgi:hypothetical protein